MAYVVAAMSARDLGSIISLAFTRDRVGAGMSKPATSTKKTEPARIEPPPKTETDTAKTETEKPSEEKPAVTEKPAETASSSAKTRTQEAFPAARLIIEEKDGTRIDRPMSTVRRVTIEGNVIVIILKTGKIERVAMADVARMSIEPQ